MPIYKQVKRFTTKWVTVFIRLTKTYIHEFLGKYKKKIMFIISIFLSLFLHFNLYLIYKKNI